MLVSPGHSFKKGKFVMTLQMHQFGRFGLPLVPNLFNIPALKRGELGRYLLNHTINFTGLAYLRSHWDVTRKVN